MSRAIGHAGCPCGVIPVACHVEVRLSKAETAGAVEEDV